MNPSYLWLPVAGKYEYLPSGRVRLAQPIAGTQAQFLDNWLSRQCGYIAGAGAGKSWDLYTKAFEQVATTGPYPGLPLRSIALMPTERMLEDVTIPICDTIVSTLSELYGIEVYWRAKQLRYEFPNNHWLLLRPAEKPGRLKGPDYTCAYCDEITEWDGEKGLASWTRVSERCRDPRPERRQVNFIGSPVMGHWLKTEVLNRATRVDQGEPHIPQAHESVYYRMTTLHNPTIPDDQILAFFKYPVSSHFFQVNVLGRWPAILGAVYPEFDQGTHLRDYTYEPGAPVILAIDPGRTYHTVLFAAELSEPNPLGIDGWPSVCVFDQICHEKRQTRETIQEMGHILEFYGLAHRIEGTRWEVSDKVECWLDPKDATTPRWKEALWEILRLDGYTISDPALQLVPISEEIFRRALKTHPVGQAGAVISLWYSSSLIHPDKHPRGKAAMSPRGAVESMELFKHRRLRRTGQITEKTEHSIYAHACDAGRYLSVGIWGHFDTPSFEQGEWQLPA